MSDVIVSARIDDIVAQVSRMPADWHGAGSLSGDVLSAIARHATRRPLRHSIETGTGKSTLVLSHCSDDHTVFAQDDRGHGDSLQRVQGSPLLRRDTVAFVVGPTQRTLPAHVFTQPLDLVMLDGPHGYPFPELEYYFVYQHLAEGAVLIVDDIHIPTVYHLFCVLREDEMFRLDQVVQTTAFFVRTAAPLFDPLADGWWLQQYNKRRFPSRDEMIPVSVFDRVKQAVPEPAKALGRRLRALRARTRPHDDA
jgi:hypothetical protein